VQFSVFHNSAADVGASGITGTADIPDPPRPARPRGIRVRLRAVGSTLTGLAEGVPRVIALSMRASPRLTVGLGLSTVVVGLVPAATAVMARLLMNTVVFGVTEHQRHASGGIALRVPLPWSTVVLPSMSVTWALVVLATGQLVIFTVSALAGAVTSASRQLLQERVAQIVQLRVMEQAGRLDLAFFEDARSYDLLRQTQREATVRPVNMIGTVFTLIQTTVTLTSMVTLLVGLNPWLALLTLFAPVPAFLADVRYGVRTFQLTMWGAPIKRRMDYLASLLTTDTAAKEVKLFGLGDYFVDRFRLLGAAFYVRLRRLAATRYLLGASWGMVTTLVGSVTYLFVAWQTVSGRLSLGDLALYTAAVGSTQVAVQSLFQGLSSVHENGLYLNNLTELLALRPTITAPAAPRELPASPRGAITFEHVTFSYPDADRPALRDVSFEIAAGQTVAVVGRNGAGKSTLIKLLCRLYDPTEGRILLDGNDIRDYDPAALRSLIGGMFQDHVSYQATAAENIGLGAVGLIEDRPRIEQATRAAGAEAMVHRLSSGYDTPLGKWFRHGAQLSGGQWQKVALARAFIREAPILVLDEPTSALDAEAEHDLFDRLRELASGRTTLYISHRFSTVRQADRIIVIDDGVVVEDGSHADLLDADGEYAQLYTLQAAAYADPALPAGTGGGAA
jgi:ATP-binding cassette subfamily B protein